MSGIGCLLGGAFPGVASAGPLFRQGCIEPSCVKGDSRISTKVLNEIPWYAIGLKNIEGLSARKPRRNAVRRMPILYEEFGPLLAKKSFNITKQESHVGSIDRLLKSFLSLF